MQIQLKQKEIEAALRGYIIKQGINMEGRTLAITFTSGRKDNGLSADLNIEDEAIPGFSSADRYDEEPPVPPEEPVVVSTTISKAIAEAVIDPEPSDSVTETEPEPDVVEKNSLEESDFIDEDSTLPSEEPEVVSEEPPMAVKKPLSLFG